MFLTVNTCRCRSSRADEMVYSTRQSMLDNLLTKSYSENTNCFHKNFQQYYLDFFFLSTNTTALKNLFLSDLVWDNFDPSLLIHKHSPVVSTAVSD